MKTCNRNNSIRDRFKTRSKIKKPRIMRSNPNEACRSENLGVGNVRFLLDRMARDCAPAQFVRELTQNAIESIQRRRGHGQVIWDVDETTAGDGGPSAQKLCVMDDGEGMTDKDLTQYINKLSSSGSGQSHTGNFGVGAKIATLPQNPAGVVYRSWRDGVGSSITLCLDSKGDYGLKGFELPNGTYSHVLPIGNESKPQCIGKNGTVVTLMGNTIEDATVSPPSGISKTDTWVARYLNQRYFQFPKGIDVRVRVDWTEGQLKEPNSLHVVTGQKHYLDQHSDDSGAVDLKDARAHWWILSKSKSGNSDSRYYETKGHVAALYGNELYARSNGSAAVARLQQFGVIFGGDAVVIYIEPLSVGSRCVNANTSRTDLQLGNEPLPWDEWAAEFSVKLPPAIEALIAARAAQSDKEDHGRSIQRRLKPLMGMFEISQFRPSALGDLQLDTSSPVCCEVPDLPDATGNNSADTSRLAEDNRVGLASMFTNNDGPRGRESPTSRLPTAKWISEKDETRARGDLEDRAARYLLPQNTLLINADFRVFEDMIAKMHAEWGRNGCFLPIIRTEVHSWYEQALVETVLGVQGLRKSREWPKAEIEAALSERSLTVAVMQLYHIHTKVRDRLSRILGSHQRLPVRHDPYNGLELAVFAHDSQA